MNIPYVNHANFSLIAMKYNTSGDGAQTILGQKACFVEFFIPDKKKQSLLYSVRQYLHQHDPSMEVTKVKLESRRKTVSTPLYLFLVLPEAEMVHFPFIWSFLSCFFPPAPEQLEPLLRLLYRTGVRSAHVTAFFPTHCFQEIPPKSMGGVLQIDEQPTVHHTPAHTRVDDSSKYPLVRVS